MMETQTASSLFSGSPALLGGLSNEDDLAKACPDQFKHNNPWSNYAMQLFFKDGNIANWKWKSGSKETHNRQIGCFHGLLSTFGLSHQDKEAVAGWMLSEMLVEVPEYVPKKKN